MNDKTTLLRTGLPSTLFFHQPIRRNNFIEKDINGSFFEIWIGVRSGLTVINRTTPSLLDLVSATGGLIRAFTLTGLVVMNRYTLYVLNSFLASNIVRFVPSKS